MTAMLDRVRPLPFDESWLDQISVPAEPGIYDAVPFGVYERIPALTRRTLAWIDPDNGGSPKHARAAYDGILKGEDRDAWRFGRAEHTLILEGEEELRKRWDIAPDRCQATKASGEPCEVSPSLTDGRGGWWCGRKGHAPDGAARPTDYITEADVERMRRMHESLMAHPFSAHMRRLGWREVTVVFDCPIELGLLGFDGERELREMTLRHRTRLDFMAEATRGYPPTIVDLKRMPVGGGSTHNRERAILSAELHVQAGLYVQSVRSALGLEAGERVDFVWLFIEEGRPHDVVPLPASEEVIQAGIDTLDRRRLTWALCEHLGKWPGRTEIRQLENEFLWGKPGGPPAEPAGGLPTWKLKEFA